MGRENFATCITSDNDAHDFVAFPPVEVEMPPVKVEMPPIKVEMPPVMVEMNADDDDLVQKLEYTFDLNCERAAENAADAVTPVDDAHDIVQELENTFDFNCDL